MKYGDTILNSKKELSIVSPYFVLLLLGLAAYGNAIAHPFVHDDVVFIQQNPRIAHLDFKEIFLRTEFSFSNIPLANAYYRPLLEVLYRLQYKVFHLHPEGYHLFNIGLHIFNSFLVYYLLSLLRRDKKGMALGVAVLFLLHPVQTEAVACIAGISNLLFAFLCLLSFIFYVQSSAAPKRNFNEFLFYVYALTAFTTALFAKEQAAILPFLIILYELTVGRHQNIPLRPRMVRALGFFVVLAGYLAWRKILLDRAFFAGPEGDPELVLRLLSMPQTLLMFLRIIFAPYDLHYYRNINFLEPFMVPLVILAAVFMGLALIIRWMGKDVRPFGLFGLGWFGISLLPTLNIVPLVNEFSYVLAAEHFLYFPLIGFFWFLFEVGGYALGKESDKKSIIVAVLGLACLLTTIQQNTYWRGEIPLFERMLRFEPNFGRGHILLGKAYYFNHQMDKAMREYGRALEIMEGYRKRVVQPQVQQIYIGFIKGIHFDLAHCYEGLNDFSKAIEHYQQAIVIDPRDSVLYNNAGLVYLKLNDANSAIGFFQKAIALDRNNLSAMNNLAVVYIQNGKINEARMLWKEILRRDSHFISAQQNLEHLLSLITGTQYLIPNAN